MSGCPLNQYRDELAICSPCENICYEGIPLENCYAKPDCQNLYINLIRKKCLKDRIYDHVLDLCEECVASGCYEQTSVYSQEVCDAICPLTPLVPTTKIYNILTQATTQASNSNGTLPDSQGLFQEYLNLISGLIAGAILIILVIIIVCIIFAVKKRRSKHTHNHEQQDAYNKEMTRLFETETGNAENTNVYEEMPRQPINPSSESNVQPSSRSSQNNPTTVSLNPLNIEASRRPSNREQLAYQSATRTGGNGGAVSQESQHAYPSESSFRARPSVVSILGPISTVSDTKIAELEFEYQPYKILIASPESERTDMSLVYDSSPLKSPMDTTAKLKPSKDIYEAKADQNTKYPSKRSSDVHSYKNDEPVKNETFLSNNAHGDPPEKAPLYNGYNKSPPVSKSNVRDSRQASDFDPYYSPYRNNGPVQHTDPHNNSGYSSGYHLNGDDLQNSESPRSLYNFKEDDPYKDRLDQMFPGPPSPKLPSVKQELTTEEEVRNLPIGGQVIPNVREKFGVLKEFTWIKRVVSNGKYFLIKYDSIDRASAEKLILEKVGLVQHQYKLVSE